MFHLDIKYNRGVKHKFLNQLIRIIAVSMAIVTVSAFSTAADTEKSRLERGLFTIIYPESQHKVAERTLSILEEAVREFASMLPVGQHSIFVVLTDAPDEFERYAAHFSGLDVSGLAQPGNDLIIVKAPKLRMPDSDYPGTLRHELVHLLLYRNIGDANLPQWLNEGIAMSLANEFYWQGMFTVARMFIQNRIIPLHLLENSFYSPANQTEFNDAYAQSLSMTRYLRNRLGERLFWRMIYALRVVPFPQALGEIGGLSLDELWNGYRKALWKYALYTTMASGFFFQPAAILLIIGYLRRRKIARDIYRRWEAEESEDVATGAAAVHWEELVEEPDAWKQNMYEEEDTW